MRIWADYTDGRWDDGTMGRWREGEQRLLNNKLLFPSNREKQSKVRRIASYLAMTEKEK